MKFLTNCKLLRFFKNTNPVMERKPKPEHAEHEAVALRAAQEGIVLLKNNSILPLEAGTVVNLFGAAVHHFHIDAGGAGKTNPSYKVNLIQAIERCDVLSLNNELVEFYRCDKNVIPDEAVLKKAKEVSDIAVFMLARESGENRENTSKKGEFYLTDEEDALIRALRQTFAHVIVILNVGYPMDVRFVEEYDIDALIYNGFGGMLAGQALCDVLCGKVNPSGKLPDTWAKEYADIPASRNFYDAVDKKLIHSDIDIYVDTVYEEGIYVGYRYFSTFGVEPAYPFGYGLSYSNFEITSTAPCFEAGVLKFDVCVKNTSVRAGKEVVQVYIRKPESLCETPERELVWFDKTKELALGESQTFEVEIPAKHMVIYDTARAVYVMPKGEYQVFVGNSSLAEQVGYFTTEEILVKQASHLMLPVEAPEELSKYKDDSFPKGRRSGTKKEKAFLPAGKRRSYDVKPLENLNKEETEIKAFVENMSVKELAKLHVSDGMRKNGVVGLLKELKGYDLPKFTVADGNCGVNCPTPNISMPSSTTMAASFNKPLMEEIGRAIAEEAKDFGIPMILAPGMNLHRNPLNGRQPEYFSEDPYLSGILAGHYTKGMEEAGIAACMKHLAGNNCETSRKRNQSIISERALRELYLRNFQLAMEVHEPAAFMTAYNAINGKHTATDAELIQGFLREEMGFQGFVMTDWNSYDTMDVADAVEAGNCWMTPGTENNKYVRPIIKAVKTGRVNIERLRENAYYMLSTIKRFMK